MNYDKVLRGRISELEKELEKTEKKMVPGPNAVKYAVEAEKIRYAINQLYLCIGRISSKTNKLRENDHFEKRICMLGSEEDARFSRWR